MRFEVLVMPVRRSPDAPGSRTDQKEVLARRRHDAALNTTAVCPAGVG
jgi:hypothetical protein